MNKLWVICGSVQGAIDRSRIVNSGPSNMQEIGTWLGSILTKLRGTGFISQ
jgi:hypothetical protein